ncbi:hypothetical protein F442_21474 [Phytophthora nicotianae P10297]|uniref:Uncharacterized protein n=1 Tax=Phytophthora nicotianae P10297 TaxID=1317064 RepID=W2Y3Z7_PHYNI|nr:hypothetical protein F442_21474 [Phytophthora nicotianae P10297]
MTAVSICVGIEMRGNLCRLGLRCIQDHTEQYQLLNKVVLKIADVRDVPISSQPLMRDATLVFTNIFLFEEDAKLVVARELTTIFHLIKFESGELLKAEVPCLLMSMRLSVEQAWNDAERCLCQ